MRCAAHNNPESFRGSNDEQTEKTLFRHIRYFGIKSIRLDAFASFISQVCVKHACIYLYV